MFPVLGLFFFLLCVAVMRALIFLERSADGVNGVCLDGDDTDYSCEEVDVHSET